MSKLDIDDLLGLKIKTKKQRIISALWKCFFAVVLACIGAYFIDDMKVFFGVFLLLWANNVGNSK